MFCPQCGAPQSDELRYCKLCGVNLNSVRQAVAAGDAGEKFDWGKTWVAEMLLSPQEAVKRKAELERLQGITPEVKRYGEIKGGVITSFVGLGVAIFLFVISEGIIRGGQLPPDEAEIVRRVWAVGVIPFLIGLGIIFNGLFITKKQVEAERRERQLHAPTSGAATGPRALRPGDTSEFIPSDFSSVTEGTTKHLKVPAPERETQ